MGSSLFQNCICDCIGQDIEEKSRRINSRRKEEHRGRQVGGRGITKAHSSFLFATAAIHIQTHATSCETCGEQGGTEAGCLRVLPFPLPILIPSNLSLLLSIIQNSCSCYLKDLITKGLYFILALRIRGKERGRKERKEE
jgi:hypothetical protein